MTTQVSVYADVKSRFQGDVSTDMRKLVRKQATIDLQCEREAMHWRFFYDQLLELPTAELADPDAAYQRLKGEVYLAEIDRELAYRERVKSGSVDQSLSKSLERLRDEIVERVDMVTLLQHWGIPMAHKIDRKRDGGARCPRCGGFDRFVLFRQTKGDDRGYAWCRQCGLSGDVITIYREITGYSWRRTIEDMAVAFLGVTP